VVRERHLLIVHARIELMIIFHTLHRADKHTMQRNPPLRTAAVACPSSIYPSFIL
jgi:hypothetical protein